MTPRTSNPQLNDLREGDRRPLPVREPRVAIPDGACDCHVHVFGPYQHYPLTPVRSYTPPEVPLVDLRGAMQRLGLTRMVLVQPSPFGADNRCLLDALSQAGSRARGVVVISDDTEDETIARLTSAGVRGARINVFADNMRPDVLNARIRRFGERLAAHGWHLELHVDSATLPSLRKSLEQLDTNFVLDHLARLANTRSENSEILTTIDSFLESSRCWIKLSGSYRLDSQDGHSHDVSSVVQHYVERRPDRLVWGSDWPHTGEYVVEPGNNTPRQVPLRAYDTGRFLDLLADWVPDEQLRTRILVDNPATLYGFD